MRIEMIATGEELLDGRVTNTNARDLAAELKFHGLGLSQVTTVGDDPAVLLATFREVAQRADVAIVTGGLGPTDDDRTAAVLAEQAGVDLVLYPEWMERLNAYFGRLQRPMSESNKKQAYLPEGSEMIDNPSGTAAGISMEIDGCVFFALPGVPREMRQMMQASIIPIVLKMTGGAVSPPATYTFKTFGLGESKATDRLASLYPLPTGVDIGFRAKLPEVHLTLKIFPDLVDGDVETHLNRYCKEIRERLGAAIFTENADESFVGSLGRLLREKGWTLAMAESCTGGMVGSMLTEEGGSSTFFRASVVTYSNEAKRDLLGVEQALLDEYGAVSEPVARAMAEGARRVALADIAASITGVAGPSGGTPEKPVGTVHVAVATATETEHFQLRLTGSRERIRVLSAYGALQMIRRILTKNQDTPLFLSLRKRKA